MFANSALAFLQERVVIVEWQRGLIGWLLIGLIAGWLAGGALFAVALT